MSGADTSGESLRPLGPGRSDPPETIRDIVLMPGDFYFGGRDCRIRTSLGSCVAITLWHPEKQIGGMCHYLLPTRSGVRAGTDGRYADEAMELFMQKIAEYGTVPAEYKVKLFGGARMLGGISAVPVEIGPRNVEVGRRLLRKHGFKVVAESTAGEGTRLVILDVWSGDVWVRVIGGR